MDHVIRSAAVDIVVIVVAGDRRDSGRADQAVDPGVIGNGDIVGQAVRATEAAGLEVIVASPWNRCLRFPEAGRAEVSRKRSDSLPRDGKTPTAHIGG
jgi:hypothetical protein